MEALALLTWRWPQRNSLVKWVGIFERAKKFSHLFQYRMKKTSPNIKTLDLWIEMGIPPGYYTQYIFKMTWGIEHGRHKYYNRIPNNERLMKNIQIHYKKVHKIEM